MIINSNESIKFIKIIPFRNLSLFIYLIYPTYSHTIHYYTRCSFVNTLRMGKLCHLSKTGDKARN